MIKYFSFSSILLIFFILFYSDSISKSFEEEKNLFITHGVASGDVTNNSSIIWSKSNSDSIMNVKYDYNKDFSSNPQIMSIPVNESTFFTGHIKLTNLVNSTTYYYQIWFTESNNSSSSSNSMIGKFKTAPDAGQMDNIHFTMAGDLGGSTLCRQEGIGYPIFSIMNNISPDFFIFNGDQIYADNECPLIPKFPFPVKNYPFWKNIKGDFKSIMDKEINWENINQLNEAYLEHWKYNRADPYLQTFLSNTSFYSQSDDHEVINNYGGKWENYSISDYQYDRNRNNYPNLVNVGIDLFFKFSPIERNQIEKDQIYRSFNWGKNLDLYLLDAHSYRSLNNLPDTRENNKTLYGKEQIDWLKNKLLSSSSTWKIVSTPVPITVPNCFYGPTKLGGCDNWATNNKTNETFVKERNEFLKFLDKYNIKNVIFIAGDVHFAGTVNVTQDFDEDGDTFTFYEIINGPLNANTYNITIPVDTTINAKYLYNESTLFNFGNFKIEQDKSDNKFHFLYNAIDANGRVRPNSDLNLIPQ